MRFIELFAILFALLVASGCDEVTGPGANLDISQIAVSNDGTVGVLAAIKGQRPHVWLRKDFREEGVWTPLCNQQVPHEDRRALFIGGSMTVLRTVGGKTDVYRAADGARLTNVGDIADATSVGGAVIVLRPWGNRTHVAFIRTPQGAFKHLFARQDVIVGTLAGYDLGNGPALCWAERRSKGHSVILRYTLNASRREIVLVAKDAGSVLPLPLGALLEHGYGRIGWIESDPTGLRCRWAHASGGTLTPGLREADAPGPAAVSLDGRWATGWDAHKHTLIRDQRQRE